MKLFGEIPHLYMDLDDAAGICSSWLGVQKWKKRDVFDV